MSLADELLADLEEIENDVGENEVKIKDEPIDEVDFTNDVVEKMEIDESVKSNIFKTYNYVDSFTPFICFLVVINKVIV